MLHATFCMKDLGQLTYFLGLEVHHRSNGIYLNQHKYIQAWYVDKWWVALFNDL
uniref:Reverse transcriptase Ty1/copia-type domain-containing protein n=1 Tax=Cajanus cajan TaxID=3821 RepID=A0A151S4Z6_CAJCA|nr:hypothetical protein KK1_028372 [Cajanus cajan]